MKQFKNQDIYEQLYQLQEEYNWHTNITRISSKEDYYLKHIQDSLLLIDLLPPNTPEKIQRLIDIGSGAGYPGLPIAIERPQMQVFLNDSVQKKTKYLLAASEKLGLKNITVVNARAEVLGQDLNYREKFDFATARAVASLPVLLEYLAPLVGLKGKVLVMKAKNIEEELASAKNAVKILGLELTEVKKFDLEGLERAILVYQKSKFTPEGFPRRPGVPEKNPL